MIRSLELINFRSFPHLELQFEQPLIILYGPNGIGKTNILESIYMLAVAKSFRAPDPQVIHHDQDFYVAKKSLANKTFAELRYQNNQAGKQKRLLWNGKKQAITRLLGRTPVVLFAPTDIEILTAPSSARRELVDTTLTQTHQTYARELRFYRKILQGRNALLRRHKQGLIDRNQLDDQLFVCDLQIIKPANYLIQSRQNLIDTLNPFITQKYQQIAHKTAKHNDEIELIYQPSVDSNTDLAQVLRQNLPRDLGAGHTTVGPHRDDISFRINHHPLAATASRGEMRTVMLAIKLAELDYIKDKLNIPPTLLLDDVFSELDHHRQHFLLDSIGDAQTVITTTEVDHLQFDRTKPQLINIAQLVKL